MESSMQFEASNTALLNISTIKQSLNKLQYLLDYDKSEIDRLRADLEYILNVDINEYTKHSLFSTLSLKNAIKNDKKLTAVNIQLLNACNSATHNERIEILNIYISRLTKMQQTIADNKYDIRNYALNPYSNRAKGLIIILFNMLETDWNCVQTNIKNLEIYLANNFNENKSYKY